MLLPVERTLEAAEIEVDAHEESLPCNRGLVQVPAPGGPGPGVGARFALEGPVRLGQDLETIVKALYPVQLELDAPIHASPASAAPRDPGLC